jgi:hypothetical protein
LETLEELKKWVETLSIAEKRFIKLLGKARAGSAESQQLELLDWLNQRDDRKAPPPTAKFMHNLPTVANRLKDLILDGLRLMYKERNIDSQLRTTLDEIAILFERRLYHVVARQSKRAKKVALDHCRYASALQCIEWEQKLVQILSPGDSIEQLKGLHVEEAAVALKLTELQELRYLHDNLRARTRQSFPRDAETLQEFRAIARHKVVLRLSKDGAYIDQALAVNILGICDLCEGRPLAALGRYAELLDLWNAHPDWQLDQSALLLTICSQYQIACFLSPINSAKTASYLAKLPDFKVLAPELALDIQRSLYHNQLTLALNEGDFTTVNDLIAEIDQWLVLGGKELAAPGVLIFLHNFAVAEFLQGKHAAANRFVQRILNISNRKAKTDIRDFALLLQAVLHHDMGEMALAEYQTRAAKRHFLKKTAEVQYEILVLHYLEATARAATQAARDTAIQELIAALSMVEAQASIPNTQIGLMEMRLWAEAKHVGKSIQAVFLQAVKENLDTLD